MQNFAPLVGAIAELAVALAVLLFALFATRGLARVAALLLALLIALTSPLVTGNLVMPSLVALGTPAPDALAPDVLTFGEIGSSSALESVPTWVGLLTMAVALGALAFGGLATLERMRRPSSYTHRRGFASASVSPARRGVMALEAKQIRLRGLLKREHAKLETATEMHRYFELATKNSQITMSYQDAELTYRWIVNPRAALTPENVLGRTDDDYLPDSVRPLVIGHKRRALSTNTTQTFELELTAGGERIWYRVDVVPISEHGLEPTGIVCTAIDITRSKRLDMMRTDLSRRLAETLQRFNLALRSEKIMVFSQDLGLRYTWANSDETQVGSIIGRTDEEIIPEKDRPSIVGIKQKVIATKRPASAEIGVGEGDDRRWYDLHVEPNLKPDGSVSGITCASIDVTHRKRNEEQMHLVMRELTHRTKNLLTVVIAIARQTSAQATTVETFVPALIARLRALSAAQDLIVADDWAGVNIGDLVRALVGQYVPPQSSRVDLKGPSVILSPEAAQNLGLAIHELSANAVQYGAFANSKGTLSVAWDAVETERGSELSLVWTEAGGPEVSEPTTRGFGMMVIERNLSRALGAKVQLSFLEDGLCASILLPLRGVRPLQSPDRERLAKVG